MTSDCLGVCGEVVWCVDLQVFFAVIIGSFSLGNALPELETFGTALGAAAFVFKVIDRVSQGEGGCGASLDEHCCLFRNQSSMPVLTRERSLIVLRATSSSVTWCSITLHVLVSR